MNIKTHLGVLQKEATDLNKGFYKWVKTGLPWLICKIAQSENRLMGINNKSSHWITNEISRKHTHELRSRVDAILIGKNTAQVDNPSLTVRLVNGNNPIRVIADTSRTLPQDLKIFTDDEAETIVLCSSNQFSDNHTTHCKFIAVNEKDGMLDPEDILKHLANIGITSILIEGGPRFIRSFHNQGLIDELYEYTAPGALEGKDMKNPIEIDSSWSCTCKENLGDDRLVIYKKKEVECLVE
jgi:diaminohydroxyphosphoribosylaminopyrimidine deaminase/5-amino-6-(5-phosphoribosylamino)uracil reductase